jgi:O-methyltransferase involved in polyketide biosynthesis
MRKDQPSLTAAGIAMARAVESEKPEVIAVRRTFFNIGGCHASEP